MLVRKNALFILSLFSIMLLSCSVPFTIASTTSTQPTPVVNSLPLDTATAMPAAPTSQSATPTTNQAVVITVATGSLNVRRGPSIYYDGLDFLKTGASATAQARNSEGNWLYIPLPNDPSSFGWVSASTELTTLQGDVNSLPVKTTDPAQPAYIRNCTYHPMMIKPGDVLLQPQTDTTGRKAHFAPGIYSAYDQNVSNKKVLTVELKEGMTVDILTSGLGISYTCP